MKDESLNSKTGSLIMPVEFHSMHSDLFDQFCIFSNNEIRVFGFSATEAKEHSHLIGQIGHKLFHTFSYEVEVKMFSMVLINSLLYCVCWPFCDL